MKRTLILTAIFAAFFTATLVSATDATADVIVFTNGRSINGKVIDENPKSIRFAVAGGVVQFPRASIAQIKRTLSPDQQITQALEKADRNDPDDLDRISALAASFDLTRRSADLRKLASGIRLEKRLEAVKNSRDPLAFIELESWASLSGYSYEVRRFILKKAQTLAPRSAAIQRRLDGIQAEQNRAELAEDLDRARAEIAQREAEQARLTQAKAAKKAKLLAKAAKTTKKTKARDPKAQEIARLKREIEAERDRLEEQRNGSDDRINRLRRARRRAAVARNRRAGNNSRRRQPPARPTRKQPTQRRRGLLRIRIGG